MFVRILNFLTLRGCKICKYFAGSKFYLAMIAILIFLAIADITLVSMVRRQSIDCASYLGYVFGQVVELEVTKPLTHEYENVYSNKLDMSIQRHKTFAVNRIDMLRERVESGKVFVGDILDLGGTFNTTGDLLVAEIFAVCGISEGQTKQTERLSKKQRVILSAYLTNLSASVSVKDFDMKRFVEVIANGDQNR